MVEASHQIGFAQIGLGSVLSQHTLHVPPNQREYSWTEREVSGLFQDLNRAIAENADGYFLGSVVTIPERLGVLEVVDGQQRLATTAILLAAMRDALKGRDADKLIVERIDNTFLSTIDPRARQRVPRLRLNLADAAYFDRRVLNSDALGPALARSHRLINDASEMAAAHVAQVLKPYNETDYGDAINRWIEFVEHRAIVILLKVPTEANAYKMFETLNDRGLRTSQADLVKNYLFGQSGDRLAEAQQKWAAMKAVLESVTEDDAITVGFIRQMLISLQGHVTDAQVYDRIQATAKGSALSIQLLGQLEAGASDYAALLNSGHEKWNGYPPSTRRSVQTLNVLRLPRPMRPLMLSMVRALTPKEADRSLAVLVSLSVRFLICGGMRTGTVEETLAAAAKAVSDGDITNAAGLTAALAKIIPGDARFADSFRIATVSGAHFARYYLRSLETTVKGEPDPYLVVNEDSSVINLEHVLPQKPGANWPQFTPEAAVAFGSRLGNMALLQAKKNADLHSASFHEKRSIYAETPYEWTRQIAELDEWTTEAINIRQAKMAEVALKTWKIDFGKQREVPKPNR